MLLVAVLDARHIVASDRKHDSWTFRSAFVLICEFDFLAGSQLHSSRLPSECQMPLKAGGL